MALPQDPINKFAGHIAAMRSFISYIVTMMETFPLVVTRLNPEQRREIFEPCVTKWIECVRELYQRPDLYSDPPNPLPVDPKCSGAAMSDHVKERLGRNHPLFDFANAPFTHPLGTQVSMICINYSWDAYATFVVELISLLKVTCANDQRVSALIEKERVTGVNQTPTNDRLRILEIYVEDEEVAEAVRRNYELQAGLTAQQVTKIVQVAKELRSCFAHRFGQPSEKLIKIIKSSRFEEFPVRLTRDGYEVTLVASRTIAEVIQVLAH